MSVAEAALLHDVRVSNRHAASSSGSFCLHRMGLIQLKAVAAAAAAAAIAQLSIKKNDAQLKNLREN